jgi:dTMP kinase
MSIAVSAPLTSAAAATEVAARGRFLVFEGIDGSGKSTVARTMHERMMAAGRPSVLTAEPTESWIGDMVRRGNKEAASPFTETLLYVADRAEHTAQIDKWLNEGKNVVCDRYVGSTLAYQALTLRPHLGEPAREWLRSVNAPFTLRPDVTFLLLLDPELAMERLGSRPGREKFEKLDFLRSVDEEYRRLAEKDGYVIIDAARPLEQVAEDVWNIIARM